MTKYSTDDLSSTIKLNNTAEDVAETFFASYYRFGKAFLDEVKKQKVLFHIHSIDRWITISEAILLRVRAAAKVGEITEDEAQQLLRFINEHRVINLPKIHIHSNLNELKCWQIPREVALLEVAAEIEAQLRHHHLTMQKKLEETQFPSIAENKMIHSGVKHLLEDGRVVIREVLRRNPKTANTEVDNCRWNEVLNLADQWDAIQYVEDRYAYFNQSLFIDNNEKVDLVVCRPRSFAFEGVLDFAEYRAMYFDMVAIQIAQSNVDVPEVEIASGILANLSTNRGTKFDLLLDRMSPNIEKYVQILRSGRRQAVEESHLAILEGTEEYKAVIFPIFRAWDCLHRLSILRKLALDQLSKTHTLYRGQLVFVLSQERLVQYFQEFGEIDLQQAQLALRLLMFNPNKDKAGTYDPYLTPFISLNQGRVLILDAYVQNGRFIRNALKLLTKHNLINLDSCGPLLERHFQEILKAANFKTNEGRKVRILDFDGNERTDLDVVAYSDGVLLLGQAKTVLPPGNLYEIYRLLQTLEDAATQLRVCVENLDANKETIKHAIGLPKEKTWTIKKIFPYIFTNDITLTGHRIDGFLVLDPVIIKDTLDELVSNQTSPEVLITELESFADRHKEHEDRVRYYELNFGSIIFLIPGVSLFPIVN